MNTEPESSIFDSEDINIRVDTEVSRESQILSLSGIAMRIVEDKGLLVNCKNQNVYYDSSLSETEIDILRFIYYPKSQTVEVLKVEKTDNKKESDEKNVETVDATTLYIDEQIVEDIDKYSSIIDLINDIIYDSDQGNSSYKFSNNISKENLEKYSQDNKPYGSDKRRYSGMQAN